MNQAQKTLSTLLNPERTSEVDTKTNRSKKFIQKLLDPKINPLMLFWIDGNGEPNFYLPPGLSERDIRLFELEFLSLFEKYAKKVNGGA